MVMTWRFLTIEEAAEFAQTQERLGWQVVVMGLEVTVYPADGGRDEG